MCGNLEDTCKGLGHERVDKRIETADRDSNRNARRKKRRRAIYFDFNHVTITRQTALSTAAHDPHSLSSELPMFLQKIESSVSRMDEFSFTFFLLFLLFFFLKWGARGKRALFDLASKRDTHRDRHREITRVRNVCDGVYLCVCVCVSVCVCVYNRYG